MVLMDDIASDSMNKKYVYINFFFGGGGLIIGEIYVVVVFSFHNIDVEIYF